MEPFIEQGKCDAVIRSLDHGRFTIAGNRCVNSRRPQKMVARSESPSLWPSFQRD